MGSLGRVGLRKVAATGGEVNSGVNVGVGVGKVFKDKPALDLRFRSILAGAGITINNLTDEIEIVAAGGSGSYNLARLEGVLISTDRAALNWLDSSKIDFTVTDDGPSNETEITATIIALSLVNGDISLTAAIALSKLANINTNRLLGRQTAAAGPIEEISLDSSLELVAATTLRRAAITGDISIAVGSNVAAIVAGVIVDADINASAAILQSKLVALVNANLPVGTAFQRKRTDSGATAIEDFTEEAALVFTIGDGVAVVSTGVKMHIRVPFDLEITRWTLLAKQSGSIVCDVNRFTSLANFDADTKASITGTDTPDLVADRGDESTALTGWTTVLTQGDILEIEVDSATTITRVTLVLRVNKRG